MLGTILDEKYRLDRLLGKGGMGSVYAATDVRTDEIVAVKMIQTQLQGHPGDIAARFEREARAAFGIDTEHIARCTDSGTDAASGQPYMVLEYLEGEDFHRVLRRTGPLDSDVALRVIAQACLGLARAHEAGVIHRDIKPANLFLAKRSEGDERVVKILDFGVAKIMKDPEEDGIDSEGLTRTGSMLGSPLYMSPEQARFVKKVDPRADVWSLGVVLYKALAGRTPFDHISGLGDLVLALWNEPPPPVQQFAPWVSIEIAALLDRMLRIEPSERFQSAKEVLDEVRPLLHDGIAIHESMLVPMSVEARQRTSPTFFRRHDTKPRPQDRPRTDPTLNRPITASSTSSSDSASGATPRPTTDSGVVARSNTGGSGSPGPLTQSGLSTTDPGLAKQRSAPPPAKPTGMKVAVVALAGIALGVGAVFVLRPHSSEGSGQPVSPPATAQQPLGTQPEPTVAPAKDPLPTATVAAASAASTASAAPSGTAAATSTAAISAAPGHPDKAPSARPKTSAAPSATAAVSAAPQPTTRPFTDFGDRK